MIAASVIAAVLGVLATWAATARLGRRTPPPDPVVYWLLGLAGPLPGWLVGFAGLLGPSALEPPGPARTAGFILSSAAGLLGVILSDAAVGRRRASGRAHPPATYWGLGLAAVAPAWAIALLGLAWIRP